MPHPLLGADPRTLPPFGALFESVVDAAPGAPAVVDPAGTLSYQELDARAAAVAHGLLAEGRPAGEPVAVLCSYDAAAVVAFLGAVRSGRPLVFLDAAMPEDRLRVILGLAGATSLLADDAHHGLAVQIAPEGTGVLPLEDLAAGRDRDRAGLPALDPGTVAAILFTSGSSGLPKGVVWDQRLITADALSGAAIMGYTGGERVAMALPLSFAAGAIVLVGALAAGAVLHMCDPREVGATEFLRRTAAERVTALHGTPSLLRGLVRAMAADQVLPDLRLVSACGEALFARDIAAVRPHLGDGAVVVQWFGSSEGCVLASLPFGPDAPLPDGAIPAGYANTWRTLTVVDAEGRPLPVGEPGELVVTSPLMARGYWRDPQRTAERFAAGPDGLTQLRTGDIAALEADGCVRLLGRSEAAVKIRGYFVDPSEIEAALLAQPQVAETVVVAVTEDTTTRLVAYVVPTPGVRTPSVAQLRSHLGSRLPSWMIPAHVVLMQTLPRNERGKVDRTQLPPVPPRVVEPVQGTAEHRVAEVWRRVLNVDEVGRTDDFFELGGDSLAVEEMLTLVEQTVGREIRTSDFTRVTVLADFVAWLTGDGETGAAQSTGSPDVVVLREDTSGPTVFCVAGAAASAVVFSPLAAALPADHAMVVFQFRGFERRAPAEWTIAGMVRRRLAEVRRRQPHGPYVLVGHSVGALLTLRMAQELRAQGEEVLPVLVDPFFVDTALRRLPEYRTVTAHRAPPPDQTLRRKRLLAAKTWLVMPLAGILRLNPERHEHVMYQQTGFVSRWHRPRPWTGPALGYRTLDNPDPRELWEQMLPDAAVRELPTDHNSVLRPPFVQVLAADVTSAVVDPAAVAAAWRSGTLVG